MPKTPIPLESETIEQKIYLIRGRKVMLDSDLALLYQVPTKILVQSVKRHLKRFPHDFMFLLTRQELTNLRPQIVTSSWGGRRYLPFVFTEQGIAMLSSILNSERAIQINILIMRTFVNLKKAFASETEILHKLAELENRLDKQDQRTREILDAIRILMVVEQKPKRKIGFNSE